MKQLSNTIIVFNSRVKVIYREAMMNQSKSSRVTVTVLKRLLIDLKDKRPDISFRYRLVGEMWVTNFRRIVLITEKGALFNDEKVNKVIRLPDISMIMQFEIDQPFQDYHPHFHYDVDSSVKL